MASIARDQFIDWIWDTYKTPSQVSRFSVVTAATNVRTGKVYVGWTGKGSVDPSACAEDMCIAMNAADGGSKDDLRLSAAYRPRKLTEQPICAFCQEKSPRSQYAPDATPEPNYPASSRPAPWLQNEVAADTAEARLDSDMAQARINAQLYAAEIEGELEGDE
jgi:hypothetical protein